MRVQNKKRSSRVKCWIVSVTLIIAIFVLANFAVALAFRNRELPNTWFGGENVSGLTHAQASERASLIFPRTFYVTHGSARVSLPPSAIGLQISSPSSSLSYRSTLRTWVPLSSIVTTERLPLHLQFNTSAYNTEVTVLSHTLAQAALPTHVVFRNEAFTAAPATNGYKLDDAQLKSALLLAAEHGRITVNAPTLLVTAPSSQVNITSEIQALQKQLTTKIVFAYQGHMINPSLTDIGSWYVQDGQTMSPSVAAINSYLYKMSLALLVKIANPNDLANATAYSLLHNMSHDLAIVPATNGTIQRTYCIATRDVDGSNLNELSGKLAATYNDTRGWNNSGQIAFEQVDSGCQYTVWLSTASQMTNFGAICDDYYNCQVGTNVILNYDRWTTATPPWNSTHGSLEDYRTLMIDHETGHRLGFLDNPTCPGAGQSAPVMMQQSIDLKGCVFNIWPIASEFTQLDSMLGIAAPQQPSSE